jgi:hypothetical protein
MTLYDETVAALRALAQRAGTGDDVLFCERRPLTSLEASFAGRDELARQLRPAETDALRALRRLVEAERGYESALSAIDEAGGDATEWLRALTLARSLENERGAPGAPRT